MRLLKQHKVHNLLGHSIQVAMQMTIPVAMINLALLLITASQALTSKGYIIPVWNLALMVAIVLMVSGLFIYKFVLPSFFSSWNNQFYTHGNQLRKDINELKIQVALLTSLIESTNGHAKSDSVLSGDNNGDSIRVTHTE